MYVYIVSIEDTRGDKRNSAEIAHKINYDVYVQVGMSCLDPLHREKGHADTGLNSSYV